MIGRRLKGSTGRERGEMVPEYRLNLSGDHAVQSPTAASLTIGALSVNSAFATSKIAIGI